MSFSAVLLAGGDSRRMGRDKATLDWRGRPLWQWQLEKLHALQPEKIFVSLRSDASWRPDDVDLVLDAPPSRGPLSGLLAASTAMASDQLLVLAIDMPFMTAGHLRELRDFAGDGIGVIPMINGKAEPLSAIYPKAARAILEQAWQSDNYSLQPVVRKLVDVDLLKEMPVPDRARNLYVSINEPADV